MYPHMFNPSVYAYIIGHIVRLIARNMNASRYAAKFIVNALANRKFEVNLRRRHHRLGICIFV